MNAPHPWIAVLPCGCIPGIIRCLKAQILWRLAKKAYQRLQDRRGTWIEYFEARCRYQEHFCDWRIKNHARY